MIWALKKLGKNSVVVSKTLDYDFPLTYSLLVEADVVDFQKSNMKQLNTSQNSKM